MDIVCGVQPICEKGNTENYLRVVWILRAEKIKQV
jgi:hypothetical protein